MEGATICINVARMGINGGFMMTESARIEAELQANLVGCTTDLQKLFAHLTALGGAYAVINRLEIELDMCCTSKAILNTAIDEVTAKLDELV